MASTGDQSTVDLCVNDAINYSIAQRQRDSNSPVTPPLVDPSPSEIIRILNKRYVRADIDRICLRHGIETKKSMSKASLVTAIIVKFGADALGDLD